MAHVDGTPSDGRTAVSGLELGAARVFGAVPPPILVLLGVISLQVGAAFAKQMFPAAGPAGVVALRLVFAALVLVAVWRPSLRLDRTTLTVVVGYGLVLGGMNMCIYQAIDRIPLGVAVTIEFLGPLAVAVFGSRRKLDLLWALLAGTGVLLLGKADGGLDWLGLLFALFAACLWATYILAGAKLGEHTSGGSGLALGMVFGALLALPFGVADAGTALLDPSVLAIGLLAALMSSVVPYSLELEALRRMPPRVFGVLMSLEPAVAALAGLLVLREALGLQQWAAIGCVVIASVGATCGADRA